MLSTTARRASETLLLLLGLRLEPAQRPGQRLHGIWRRTDGRSTDGANWGKILLCGPASGKPGRTPRLDNHRRRPPRPPALRLPPPHGPSFPWPRRTSRSRSRAIPGPLRAGPSSSWGSPQKWHWERIQAQRSPRKSRGNNCRVVSSSSPVGRKVRKRPLVSPTSIARSEQRLVLRTPSLCLAWRAIYASTSGVVKEFPTTGSVPYRV